MHITYRHQFSAFHQRVCVALVGWAALGAGLSCAQNAPPSAPPVTAPATAAPLTAAQQAVLQGGFATFVSQLAVGTGIRLVPVPAGKFTMGSDAEEGHRDRSEGPQTHVTLTKDFFLGTTEVTQAQYEAVMGSNPSDFKAVGPAAPVENVSWDDAMAFCRKLTAQERAAGRLPKGYAFTLPTEAQWEYACRAGSTAAEAAQLDAIAWFDQNSGGSTHPVGTKRPNAWGLYDLEGNVMEWCYDWYADKYPGGEVADPKGPVSGSYRIARGGRWNDDAAHCRFAARSGGSQGRRDHVIGFRVALSPEGL